MKLAAAPIRRKPSLTPMIDVVFLLLVFFMLASRFGQEMEINLPLTSGAEQPYQGPPRLVEVHPEAVHLNGQPADIDQIVVDLGKMITFPNDAIVLRPRDATDLQSVVDVMQRLSDAGFETLVLVE